MTRWIACVAVLLYTVTATVAQNTPAKEFYEIKIYHFKTAGQQAKLDNYLQQAFIPALHRNGVAKVGVFKPIANDTAADKTIYILIPVSSPDKANHLASQLIKDKAYQSSAKEYIDALHSDPPYTRIESVLLEAFQMAPVMQTPALKGPVEDRIYELRSYESATEKTNLNKVKMFNEGGEVALFKRLGFNAVFYANVISGSKMPNLMYMTSFENMAAREAHWKTFGDDAEWKKLSALPEYQNNVSHMDIILMKAAAYSDL